MHRWTKACTVLLLTAAGSSCAAESARAAEPATHRIDAFIAGDAWPTPDASGQGILYVGWQRQSASARVHATLNTDTLTVGVDRMCPSTRFCWGAEVRGQVAFAGLLHNYFERGRRIPELGFSASYAFGSLLADIRLSDLLFVNVRSSGRRWFFRRSDANDSVDDFRLPAQTWVFEQQVNLTAWSFADDPSTRDPHRPSWRLTGWGFGLQANYHHRLDAPQWGARLYVPLNGRGSSSLDPSASSALVVRNRPDRNLLFIRQWAAVGIPIASRVRVQITERAGWGWGEDDLTRARIGGLNPYVVPIAGLPWPNFLSGRYVCGHATVHIRVFDDVEIGPQFDVAGLRDVLRRDDDAFGFAAGIGAFIDARWGPWQSEVRFGYSPDWGAWQAEQPHLSVFALLGRTFTL